MSEQPPVEGARSSPQSANAKPATSWAPPLYRQLGWLSGVTFFLLGFGENPWSLKLGFWLFGADLFVQWVIERVESRRGCQLLGLRKALLPLWLVALVLLLVGNVVWLGRLIH